MLSRVSCGEILCGLSKLRESWLLHAAAIADSEKVRAWQASQLLGHSRQSRPALAPHEQHCSEESQHRCVLLPIAPTSCADHPAIS